MKSPAAVLLAVFAVMTVAFIFAESRAKEPIIALNLFTARIFNVSIVVMFITAMAMFGTIAYIPVFMQAVIGRSANGLPKK